MKDDKKTKQQLMKELIDMRQRFAALEASGAKLNQMERELVRPGDFADRILNSIFDSVMVVDKNYRIVDVNDSFVQQYSWAREEAIGRMCYEVTHGSPKPCDSDTCACPLEHVVKNKLPARMIHRHRGVNGEELVLELHALPLLGPEGQVQHVVEIARDVTELHRAREVLRMSEEKYRAIFDSARDGVVLVESETGLIADCNPEFERQTGREPLQLKAMKIWEIRPSEKSEAAREKFLEIMETGHGSSAELEFQKPDGEIVPVEFVSRAVTIGDEKYLLSSVRDITDHKKAEEALRQSEERFRSLVETTSDWVWEVDVNGVYTYASPKIRDLLGYGPGEVIGKTPFDFMPPQEAERVAEEFRGFVESHRAFAELENVNRHKEGRLVILETSGVPFFDAEGRLCGYRGIDRDVTERKRVEEARLERAAALARAAEIQRSRERIIAVQESLRKDIAGQIHGTVQNKLIVLMHRLAELERSSPSQQMAAELAGLRHKLSEVVEDHIRPISHQLYPSILRRGLTPALLSFVDQSGMAHSVDIEVDEEIRRHERVNPRFITEQVRLAAFRIAEEALTNAIKHADASRVTMKLGLSPEGWLWLTVQDNGRGIDMEATSAGRGIPTMRDYAEVVGGSCVVDSAPNRGTEVTARIPLAEPVAESL